LRTRKLILIARSGGHLPQASVALAATVTQALEKLSQA
jgi:hypothetical protein